MQQVIKKPLISEKSFSRTADRKFSFLADPDADKMLLKELVEELYKVDVIKINTLNCHGKIKRTRGKNGKRSDLKKFIVTLKAGQNISLFDVETEDKKSTKKDEKKPDKKETKKAESKKQEDKEENGVKTTIKKTK